MILLFLVIGLGYPIGSIKVLGVPVGPTIGVLLVGLICGHYGLTLPASIGTFGFAVFIFSVDPQAGPSFFAAFLEDGRKYIMLAAVVAVVGFGTAVALAKLFGFSSGFEAGLMAGSLTSTPTLAAAQDGVNSGLAEDDPETRRQIIENIGVGYALTYLVGAVLVILSIRYVPRVMKMNLEAMARTYSKKRGLLAGTGSDGGNAGVVSPIPSFFYVKPINERVSAGLSLTGVLGGGYDYGSNFVGRYAVKEVELAGLGLTPSIAYRVNDKLSLGAVLSVLYTTFYQEIAINTPGPGDGLAKFDDMDDFGFQGVLGLTYELSDDTLLGIVYRTEADTDLEGKIKLENVPPALPSEGRLEIEWTNPQWLEAGLRYSVSDKTDLFFNAGWQEWSAFSENKITIGSNGVTRVLDRNWQDTWYAGVAFAHRPTSNSFYSLGISYDSSPVEDEDRTLDMALGELWKVSGAYGWKLDKVDVALGATLYHFGDTPVDQTSQGVRVVGDFDTNAMLFVGGTVRYEF